MKHMTTNSETAKVFQPVEVTDALKREYEALRLTDDQARAIVANATTRVFLKGDTPPASHD